MRPFKTLVILLGAALVLAGCGDDESRQQAEALRGELREAQRGMKRAEGRAQFAEQKAATLKAELDELKRGVAEQEIARVREAAEASTAESARKLESALEEYRELVGQPADPLAPRINAVLPQPASDPQPLPRDPLDGIPPQAAQGIRDKALREWPGNLRMQAFEIEKQGKAWGEMNRYETQALGNMPYKVKRDMVAAAKLKWPLDFAMQVFEFQGQSEAWSAIEAWEKSGVPGLPFKERRAVIDAARTKWGENYKMVVYEVEKTARR